MSNTGFQTFRPAYTGESYFLTFTLDGTDDISGWALSGTLYDANGTALSTTVTVAVLDATARTIEVSIANPDFDTRQDLTLVVRRTDTGAQTVVKWGTLELTNPSAPNAWGQGFN